MKDSYYDETASGYDELYRKEQEKKMGVIREHLRVYENDLLLDVGCGIGITTNFPCSVVGLDPSEELLNRFYAEQPLHTELVLADAESIPYKDNYFDIVISVTAIQNFDDIEAGLREIRRVAKQEGDGGRIVLSFLKKSPKCKEIRALIYDLFVVKEEIEEDKDLIFFCTKQEKEEEGEE